MLRLARRLLTRVMRGVHNVTLWLVSRKRARQLTAREDERKTKLMLAPLEGRDHTGNLCGGIALAALGYQFTDPLAGMATAVGDLAMLSVLPVGSSPATVGSPAEPLTQWLPDDPTTINLFLNNVEKETSSSASPADSGLVSAASGLMDDFWLIPAESPLSHDSGGSGFDSGTNAQESGFASGGSNFAPNDWLGREAGGSGTGGFTPIGDDPVLSLFGPGNSSTPNASNSGAGQQGAPGVLSLGGTPLQSLESGGGGVSLLGEGGDEEPSDKLPVVLVVAPDSTASEVGESSGMFRIQRVGPIGESLKVYFTLEGNAISDEDTDADSKDWDYTITAPDIFNFEVDFKVTYDSEEETTSGWVTIPASYRTVALEITPYDDENDESSQDEAPSEGEGETSESDEGAEDEAPVLETVELKLTQHETYSIDKKLPSATITIDDNDHEEDEEEGEGEPTEPPEEATVTVRAADPHAAEYGQWNDEYPEYWEEGWWHGTTASFEFIRSGLTEESLTVYYKVMTKSTATSAGAGYEEDHDILTYGSVTFASGKTRKELVVTPDPDSWLEGAESLWVEIVPPPHTVEGRVWDDLNGDGIRQSKENRLEGVSVTIDPGTEDEQTVLTDKKGRYRFTNVLAGMHTLQFETPAGYIFTKLDAGDDDSRDSDANETTGETIEFEMTDEAGVNGWDAGMYRAAEISGWTWNDHDGDGLWVVGEPYTEMTVELYKAEGDELLDTTESYEGYYSFSDLKPGDYYVKFVREKGYEFTKPDVGGEDNGGEGGIDEDGQPTDADDDSDAFDKGKSMVVHLKSGDELALDAGVFRGIGDYVWEDLNADGIQDEDEEGIAGVTVTLEEDGKSPLTTTTDLKGKYHFDVTPVNDYTITISKPNSDYAFSPQGEGDDPELDSDADEDGVISQPAPGEDDPVARRDLDAGLYRAGTVSGVAWEDDDGDGIRDLGEDLLTDVEVKLYSSDSGLIDTQTTDSEGNYSFTGVTPGTYYVVFTAPETPEEYTFTRQEVGEDPAIDSDADYAGQTNEFALKSNETRDDIDAGLYRPVTIGDLVWLDDNDGIKETGEEGKDGVDVTLLQWDDELELWTPAASTTTDNDGLYKFEDRAPGKYKVSFTAPSGYGFAPAGQGGDSATDSDANVWGTTGEFTLNSGGEDLNRDAGLVVVVGDFVWEDLNADGVQDVDELGMDGVDVTLEKFDGTDWDTYETTTSADGGHYQFVAVPDGDYRVVFEAPSGYEFSTPEDGQAEFTIVDNQGNTDLDAGLYKLGKISGETWHDINGDGIWDSPVEGIFEDATISIYSADGTLLDSKSGDGAYSFEDLTPGDYLLKFTPVDEEIAALTRQGTGSAPDPNSGWVEVRVQSNGAEVRNAGLYKYASIGNLVWTDTNNNGEANTDEGVEGFKVRLKYNDFDGKPIEKIATTDKNGEYHFVDLVPGQYTVAFEPPSPSNEWRFISPATGTTTFMLESGENPTNIDARVLLNKSPIAEDDYAAVTGAGAKSIYVLANDSDPDGDDLAITNVSKATSGTVSLNDNGTPADSTDDFLEYLPNPGFYGTDSFTYTISDGHGKTNTATVTIESVLIYGEATYDNGVVTLGIPRDFGDEQPSAFHGVSLWLDPSSTLPLLTITYDLYTWDQAPWDTFSFSRTLEPYPAIAVPGYPAASDPVVDADWEWGGSSFSLNNNTGTFVILWQGAGWSGEEWLNIVLDTNADDVTFPSWGTVAIAFSSSEMLMSEESLSSESIFYEIDEDQSQAEITIVDDDSKIVFSDTKVSPGEAVHGEADDTFAETLLATFTDTDTYRTEADYEAVVDWGDGSEPETATVSLEFGVFQVRATPHYTSPGSYKVTVTVTAKYWNDPANPGSGLALERSISTHLTATIDAPPVTLEGQTVTGSLGTSAQEWILATFDSEIEDAETRYAAEVVLSSSFLPLSASIRASGSGSYEIVASSTQAWAPGTYAVSVILRDTASNLAPGGVIVDTATADILVTEGTSGEPSFEVTPYTITESTSGSLADLGVIDLDTVPFATPTATIIWGDDSATSSAVVVQDPVDPTKFIIRGAHVYAAPGVFDVAIQVNVDGTKYVRGTTAIVNDRQVQFSTLSLEQPVGSTKGPFRVAQATSFDSSDKGASYQAWVAWGDGTAGVATVYGSGDYFWIGDAHEYDAPGLYEATVTLWEPTHPNQQWSGKVPIRVTEIAEGDAYGEHTVGVVRVEAADDLDDVRMWVDWNAYDDVTKLLVTPDVKYVTNDSQESIRIGYAEIKVPAHPPVTRNGIEFASGFLDGKNYAPQVEVVKGAHADNVSWTVQATDAPFDLVKTYPLPHGLLDDIETGALTLAEFTDSDPDAAVSLNSTQIADRYHALIDWGDGTTDETGVVEQITPGHYKITSSGHAYAAEGLYQVAVYVRAMGATLEDQESTLLAGSWVEVLASPTAEFIAWQRRNERDDATWLAAGPNGSVSPNTGAVRLIHQLDFDVSPGTDVGHDPLLVYNSDTVDPRPVIEAVVPVGSIPAHHLDVVLTWYDAELNEQQSSFTFTPPAVNDGLWRIAVRPDDAVEKSGVYKWTLTVTPEDANGDPIASAWSKTDIAQVVVHDSNPLDADSPNPFGAGWWLDDLWYLVPVDEAVDGVGGMLMVYGTGESRYFRNGLFGLVFASPAEEFGTLISNGSGYTYQDEFGEIRLFGANGRQTKILDRNGNPIEYGYFNNRLSEVETPDINTVAINYTTLLGDPDDIETQFSESGGRVVQLNISDGDLTVINDADGSARGFEWDDHFVQTQWWWNATDGATTQIANYSWLTHGIVAGFELGNSLGSNYTLASAAARALATGASHQAAAAVTFGVGAITDPRLNVTSRALDEFGRESLTLYADGTKTTTVRDRGQVQEFTDGRGYRTKFKYDTRGRLISVDYPDKGREWFVRDPRLGTVLISGDNDYSLDVYTYDGNGNLLTTLDPLLNGNSYTYYDGTLAGLVKTATDARGHTTTFTYDGNRRLATETNPYGWVTAYAYDEYGNVKKVTDPLNRETKTVYDQLNRVISVTDVFNATTQWTYDAVDHVVQMTDATQVVTASEYDSRGWLISTTEAVGTSSARTFEYEYDAAGNLTVEWRPRDYDTGGILVGEPFWTKVVTQYDNRNRATSITEGAGSDLARTTWFEYDANGNVTAREYTPQYSSGVINYKIRDVFTYDSMNRQKMAVIGTEWAVIGLSWVPVSVGRITSTQYDLSGNPVQFLASDGVATQFYYDPLDRLIKTVEAANKSSNLRRTTEQGYDVVGNLAWETDGNGVKTEYAYDKLNRPIAVTEAVGKSVERTTLYEYDKVGRITWEWLPRVHEWASVSLLPDGTPTHIGTQHVYNDSAHTETIIEAANVGPMSASPSLSPLNHDTPQTTTSYDALGRVAMITDPLGRNTKFVYDELGRQTEVYGNWIEENPLLPPIAQQYDSSVLSVYDAADNLRQQIRGGEGSGIGGTGWQSVTDRYSYDVLNRQTRAEQTVSASGFTATHSGPAVTRTKYDALDRVLWEFDPNWNATGYTYSAFDEVLQVREGGTYTITSGLPDENIEPVTFLRATDYTYDSAGRLETVTQDRYIAGQTGSGPARVTTKYGYDALGRQTSVTEAYGEAGYARTTTYQYDGNDRLLATVEPLIITGKNGVPVNRTTRNTYDELGRLVRVTEAQGAQGWSRTSAFGYDAADNLVWEATPRAYGYDPIPFTTIPSALATVTVHSYDALNRRAQTIQAANATSAELGHAPPVTEWLYDKVGRVIREVSPADASDANSRLAVSYDYDSQDRVTHLTEGRVPSATGSFTPLRQTTLAYDGFGHVTSQVSGHLLAGIKYTDSNKQFQRLQESRFNYDALGRLRETEEQVDASSVRLTLTDYDAVGNLILSTVRKKGDPVDTSRVTKSEYDRLGRLVTITEAWNVDQDKVKANLQHGSPVTQYQYNAQDQLIEVIDPLGVKSTTTYDVLGRKSSEKLGADQGTQTTSGFVPLERTYLYDAADRLEWVETKNLWVVDPFAAGGPTTSSAPTSVWTQFAYDPLDRQTLQIDGAKTAAARHTITTYDAANNVVSVTTGYSPTANLTTVDNKTIAYSRPVTTQYTYDALGRLRRVDEAGDLSDGAYAALGLGHNRPWTKIDYDASGNTTLVRTNVSYSTAGDTESRTRYQYDQLGRLIYTFEGESSTGSRSEVRLTTKLYDSLDALIGVLELGDPWTRYTYDQLGNLTKQTVGDVEPLFTTFVRNVFGEVVEQSDQTGSGSKVTSEYDLLGRVKSQVKKGGWENLAYQYDAAGNLLKVTDTVYPLWLDGNGKPVGPDKGTTRTTTTQYAYDALRRKISETDTYYDATKSPTRHTTHYRYDAIGRLEMTWSRDGKIRWFGYDAVGRQVHEYWNTATATSNKEISSLNPIGTAEIANATVITTYFDAADHVTYSFQATTKLTVDAANTNRFVFVKPTASAAWTVTPYTWTNLNYDALGRLRSEQTQGTTLTYTYDAADRVVQISDSQGGWQKTEYDLAGRVTMQAMSDGKDKGAYFTFEYRGDGGYRDDHVKTILGRSGPTLGSPVVIKADLQYDVHGREVFRGWHNPNVFGHKELLRTIYQPNGLVGVEARDGLPTIANWQIPTVRYVYDEFNQVSRQDAVKNYDENNVVVTPGKETPHDATGNGPYSSQAEAQKTGYRVVSQGAYNIWHDNNVPTSDNLGTEGNVTIVAYTPDVSKGAQSVWTYEYDSRNRLISAIRQTRGGIPGVRINYAYDAFDRLVARYQTDNLADTSIGSGATLYITASGQPYADASTSGEIHERYLFGSSGQPLAQLMWKGDQPNFYLTDRQNTVLQIVNAGGDTLKRVRYSGLKAVERDGPAQLDRFEVGGQLYDQTSGLSMLGNRWYNAGIGRYLTEGGQGMGLNPYPVAENNAPNEIKPSSNPWDENMKPTGHDTVGAIAKWVTRNALSTLDAVQSISGGSTSSNYTVAENEAAKTASGLWGMGYGITPFGFAESIAPRDENGNLTMNPLNWSTNRLAHGYRMAYDGYRQAGFDQTDAIGMTIFTNAPGANAMVKIAEMIGGTSIQGTSYGQELTFSDYVLNTVGAGADLVGLFMGGRTAAVRVGQTLGYTMQVGGKVMAPLRPATTLGKMGTYTRTAAEVAGFATSLPTPWQVAGMAKQTAHGAYSLTNAGLNKVVHGWMKDSQYHDWTARQANRLGFKVCFVSGTPIQWQHGAKTIEEFKDYETYGDDCDLIVSRNEHELDGVLTLQRVLRKFKRLGLVFELKVGGRIIGTTAEHPFWVKGKGWTRCQELQVGDELGLLQPGWVRVEGVEDTGRIETVYNLEIEDDHTYFVGCTEWGFSVWAHNAGCTGPEVEAAVKAAGGTVTLGQAKYLAGRLNRGTAEGYTQAVESLQRYGLDPNEANILALRIKHGDDAAILYQRSQIEAFLDQTAAAAGIPREQLVGRSLNRSGIDEAQYLAGAGITHGTATAGTTARQHVTKINHRNNPWISTSRTGEGVNFFGTEQYTLPQQPVVAIDLARVPAASITDVSTPALAATHLGGGSAPNLAARYQEVLVRHHVPQDAILAIWRPQ